MPRENLEHGPPFCLTHQDRPMKTLPGLIAGRVGFVCVEPNPERPRGKCGESTLR
jgi:hypothetical protein